MAEGDPSKSNSRSSIPLGRDWVKKHAEVRDDGRVDVHLDSTFFRTLSYFVPDIYSLPSSPPAYEEYAPPQSLPEPLSPSATSRTDGQRPPWRTHLNVVLQVVGSRGDVQPFLALGNELQAAGHRVRLASHKMFEDFVRQAGLEFYPIGGDPAELMAFMVKNPGLIPSMDSLMAGDIQKKREIIAEILRGCWASCTEPDPVAGTPFVADAIIANPPSFGHVHCAQALAIPVHIMFTMPWTSTRNFPHPLANMIDKNSGVEPTTANFISYWLVEWLTWQGLGDVINEWRATLDLEPVPTTEGPRLLETLKIPITYCWSPALIPKPKDWAPNIDICGFFFQSPPQYKPPRDLREFLSCGPPPVYIGFGSIVIDDAEKLNNILLEAVRALGVRAIISKGWSNLGGSRLGHIEKGDVFYLGDCPHEWLFQHVSAVVHHGGAGITACGLLNGRPTTIVPFFGDQPFWGEVVAAAGAGPKPIPHQQLDSANLAEAIRYSLSVEASIAAQQLAAKIQMDRGVQQAVDSFHRQLESYDMQCDLMPDQPAVWQYRQKHGRTLKFSKLAAEILMQHLKIKREKLKLLEINAIVIENRRWDPVTGTTSALLGTTKEMAKSTSDIFVKPVKTYRTMAFDQASRTSNRDSDTIQTPELSPRPHSSDGRVEVASIDSKKGGMETTLSMAATSAAGVGGFFKSYSKGVLLDMPLAFTEGLRNMPRLYGEQVQEHKNIKDWKSGAAVGGKQFAAGIAGFADLFTKPIEGARRDGALGAAKGVGKGFANFATKTAAGSLGLVAYSFQGVYQSLRSINSQTNDLVMQRRLVEGAYLFRKRVTPDNRGIEPLVLERFDALR